MSSTPISDYALLSDCHTSALVNRNGSVDWLPFLRFDGPSLFGRILDDDAGHFRIEPEGATAGKQHYLEGTMILGTEFRTPDGILMLEDLLSVGPEDVGHELGARSPHALLRRVSCTEGEVTVNIEYVPRPEYGLIVPVLRTVAGGVLARGGAAVLFLTSPVQLNLDGHRGKVRISMRKGQTYTFVLEIRSSSDHPPEEWSNEKTKHHFDGTIRAWRSWSDLHQNYQGPWKDLVHHSGRVLQALTYYPTGAMIAAPTTSLPELPGGSRNWDYRYTWVRDASLTMQALWVAACPDESHKFFMYLADTALTQMQAGGHMQIMFGIGGEHDLSERELPHLSGWRNSSPVRLGNGAWKQEQLDVYGELLDAAFRLKDYLGDLDPSSRGFLAAAADTAARRWKEKDRGIWEIRGPARHFLHSKLMCWVALDRAVALAGLLEAAGDRVREWERIREEIRETIFEQGWNAEIGAFTQSFGSRELDASVLMMPIAGIIDAADPRMRSTVEAILRELTDERGLVYRYRGIDGLEGEEGTFLLCTFWLAQVCALGGDTGRARELFERTVHYVNHVGLLSEEVEPSTGALIGNFPQAFSHIGLINAAWAISQAEKQS